MDTTTFDQRAVLILIADRLLPQLLPQKHEPLSRVRIWSIGCQSGDEALLLLLSLLQRLQVPTSTCPFTIFATDTDPEAVLRARRLAASDHLETWPSLAAYQSLLKRGLEGHSLPETWRESLTFASHDLLTNVPFPHLNLIISYFSFSSYTETQQTELLNRLAYALVPQGFLLLPEEQGSVPPDAALYKRHEALPISFYQRAATPVKLSALGPAHQRGYQPEDAKLDTDPDQARALIEELQAALEEQQVFVQELEAQAHINREAQLAQLHLAAIVTSSEDAILSEDLDGTVTSWNEGAQRLYGYSAQEMVGQPMSRIFPPDYQEELTHMMEQIRQGERIGNYETVGMRKDGSLVPFSVTISPLKDRDGTIVGVSAIAHDITARRELEQQREAFVHLVTHELKNPLTALFGNIQLAQHRLTRLLVHLDHQLDDRQKHILEEVLTLLERSQQQMRVQRRLIDDLLDLSRIQQDTLELHLEVCDMLAVVYETVLNHQAAYPSRLIELDVPDEDEVLVYGDRDRLGQVLSNYLGNALKFAPTEKPIRVGMRLQEEKVRVWVQDKGPGLTPGQQAHIWEQYFQVSRTPVQRGWETGLGLGLYICRQFVLRQQGEVGVESTEGQGATFWFSLPIFHPHEE
jgi:PAS domain S-box-containing protein